MPFEWDENKRRINLEKHGIDFPEAKAMLLDAARVELQMHDGELRFRATGYIDERLHVMVFTMRGDNYRIISLRRANRSEENRYAAS